MLPKISVVTVSLNQGEFIRDAIESVLQQNYPNLEHLVIDGGSTDNTLEILRSYPHLKWVSEPDRGQSHALNKGFQKASGDIIAWLNADDWYEEGAFQAVAEYMSKHSVPIVIGTAVEVDRNKQPRQTVANIPRTRYDFLRHWVPYAWIAQPSVFFTRELLESVRNIDGSYIDESLHFCMDFDLWVRMAHHFPFTHHLNRILSYYRIYEDNKTGARPHAAAKENVRVFRRYSNRAGKVERNFSFIIPIQDIQPTLLAKTISSIAEQDLFDFEIILADLSQSREVGKALRNFAMDVSEKTDLFFIRYMKSDHKDSLRTINQAVDECAALHAIFATQGDVFPKNFLHRASFIMSLDITALALCLGDDSSLQNELYDEPSNNLNIAGLLKAPMLLPKFVVRKLAFQELGGFRTPDCPSLAMRELLLRIFFKGWHISIKNDLILDTQLSDPESQNEEFLRVSSLYCNAKVISELMEDLKKDPYADIRSSYGLVPSFQPQIVEAARKIMALLPGNWFTPEFLHYPSGLEEIVSQISDFAPGWYYLAKLYGAAGEKQRQEDALQKYAQITGVPMEELI